MEPFTKRIKTSGNFNYKNTNISEVPKDIFEKILSYNSPKDFLNACIALPKFCENPDIWGRRFQKDFGEFLPYMRKFRNIKNVYLDFVKTFDEYIYLIKKLFVVEKINAMLEPNYLENLIYTTLREILLKIMRDEQINPTRFKYYLATSDFEKLDDYISLYTGTRTFWGGILTDWDDNLYLRIQNHENMEDFYNDFYNAFRQFYQYMILKYF